MITFILSWGISIFSNSIKNQQTPAFTLQNKELLNFDANNKLITDSVINGIDKVKETTSLAVSTEIATTVISTPTTTGLASTALSNASEVHPLLHDVYKFMREGIVSSIFFLILMAFSHFIIRRYIRKKDDEKKILIPRLLCTICLSISIAAMLLIPITIISNEIMTTFPSSYYTQWLDRELIFSFWNKIFWGANLSLFIILPFTYFLYESEGIRGRPLGKRIKEALLVLLLVAVIFVGFVFIVFSLFYEEKEDSGLFEHFKRISTDYLPFSYSLISTFGNVVVMLSIPSGFSYLITKCINLRLVRPIEDEIKAAKMEIENINIILEKAALAGYVNINKKKSKTKKRLEELRELKRIEMNNNEKPTSSSSSSSTSSLNKSDKIMNDQIVNSQNDIISTSLVNQHQSHSLNITKNLNNIINNNNNSINNINSANIIICQDNNNINHDNNNHFYQDNILSVNNNINNNINYNNSTQLNDINNNGIIQNNNINPNNNITGNINNNNNNNNNNNENNNNNLQQQQQIEQFSNIVKIKKDTNFQLSQEEIQNLEDSRDELYLYIEKLLKPNYGSSTITRYLSSIFLTLINFAITGWVIFKVFIHMVKRSFELFQLESIKAYFDTWMSSAIDLSKGSSKLGPFESLLETTIIIYLMISAFVGFLNEPKFSNIKPRIHSTSLRKMIINTGIILLMSSSFPVVVRTLEISRFDLMGYYSHTNYLRNDLFKVIYRCSFLFIVARSYMKSFENSRLVYSFNVNLVLPLLTRFIPSFILNRLLSQSTIQKIKQQQQLERQLLKQQQISAQQTNVVKSINSTVNDSTSSLNLFSIISKNPIINNSSFNNKLSKNNSNINNSSNNNNNNIVGTSSLSLASSSSSINTTTTISSSSSSSLSSSPIISSTSSISSSAVNTATTSPSLLSSSTSSFNSSSPSNLSAPSSPILNRLNKSSNNKTNIISKNQLNLSKKNLNIPIS